MHCSYYTVSLRVGLPPKLYDLDIDTGSDLTWLQCDAPCTRCTKVKKTSPLACSSPGLSTVLEKEFLLIYIILSDIYLRQPRDQLYKPKNNRVHCEDPLCSAIHTSGTEPCRTPDDLCSYEVEYADDGSSQGVLVHDYFTFLLTNNSRLSPQLAFG